MSLGGLSFIGDGRHLNFWGRRRSEGGPGTNSGGRQIGARDNRCQRGKSGDGGAIVVAMIVIFALYAIQQQ
jgi:hypothetical protein